MSKLPQIVKFNNQDVPVFNHQNKPYVAMRPICENIGLDWASQYSKIKRNHILSKGVVIMTTPSKGGNQETITLPLGYLNGWLFGIDVNRVKPKIKDNLIKYQAECYQALYDYWHNGVAINPRKTTTTDRKPLVQAVNMLCVKSGLHQKEVWTMVHQYMGVDSIEDITLQDIPKAVEYVHRLICDLSKLDEEQLLYNEMWRQMGIMRQIEVRKELEQLKSEMHQLFKRLETATKLNSIIYDAFVQPIRPTLTQEQRDIAIQRAIEGLERSRLLLHLV